MEKPGADVFNIVNFNKPKGSKVKTQSQKLISSAQFNQFSRSSLMVYTTSDGEINLCDFREKSDFSVRPSLRMSTSSENR